MIFDKMGICMNSQELWDKTLEKLKDFINLNEKLPRLIKKKNRKTEKDKDENRLGNWINTNKQDYKNKPYCMKEENKDRREKWKKFTDEFKEYLLTYEEEWDENLNKVIDFINLNKKLPRRIGKKNRKTAENEEETRLARWIHTNKENYEKN
jgi:hypothetical protein